MRLGAIDELAKAQDKVLFDDLVREGQVLKNSTLAETKLVAREKFAVLLLRTSEGLHALQIDSDGKVEPLKIEN